VWLSPAEKVEIRVKGKESGILVFCSSLSVANAVLLRVFVSYNVQYTWSLAPGSAAVFYRTTNQYLLGVAS